jgi:PIN domain nuclease of toxin-antitoxin system
MRLLFDTHVWVWALECPDRLSESFRRTAGAAGNEIFVSAASTMELARLAEAGRLIFSTPLREWVTKSRALLRAGEVPVDDDVAMDAYELPEFAHRDPIDRLLVATARRHDMALVTADRVLLGYRHLRTIKPG